MDDFLLVTVRTDTWNDPNWDSGFIVFGSREEVGRVVNIKRLPSGSRIYEGVKARMQLARLFKEEIQYQREQEAKRKMASPNRSSQDETSWSPK